MKLTTRCILVSAIVTTLSMSSCSKKAEYELDTYTVEPTSLSEIVTATGTMESVTSVDVGTQVTGIISNLLVDFNDEVTKGQLIAEIDKTVLQSELQSADATLASAKATYDYAKINFDRNKALHAEQLISDYDYQTSEKDYDVAKMAYQKAQADRVRAAKNLTYAEITSPIDGIVVSREVEVGQTVVSNMSVASLYIIADLDHMQVVGNVDEADIGQVKVGQSVTFTVDAYPDDTFNGTVTQVRISPTTTNNVVTYEVIVSTTNPEHKLIPGMTANLSIYTLQIEDAIAVPLKSFKFEPMEIENSSLPKPQPLDGQAAHSLWIVRDNKLVQTAVELGMKNSIYQQIVSGLKKGDIVALQYEEKQAGYNASKAQNNPFMPKPPGSNKKK
ncbi:MAG: efflux RND transporter periplasmic adaptor subunit [Muribaculaceae bacterium]|nr:efflux RND transporter periplasmic adaptor subunit [Muribaculaceae bacterium]MDE6643959.1 efflux RND transporter periplasmic adaptor subunit [Muribaculaceae bacterium]